MYRLIIADDEKRIRQGLKNIIDWGKLGFEVTELFADGQDVIEYLDYVIPDVILTDIKMNYVSGLEGYFQFRAGYKIRREYENIFQISSLRESIWEGEKDEQVLDQFVTEQKKLVASNLSMGNVVTARKLFHNILEELKNVPAGKRNNVVIDILSTMHTVLSEVNEQLAKSMQSYFNYAAILSMTKAEEIMQYSDRIFDRIRLADEKKEYYDSGTMVSKAKNYIRENIYKDISQEETANYLYICPSYLSRMFKKQTGESFIEGIFPELQV